MTFEDLAFLLSPADPNRRGTVARAGPDWRFHVADAADVAGADVVIWGAPPLPSGTPLGQAVAWAARREVAVRRLLLRPPDPFRFARRRPVRPATLRIGHARNLARSALLSGTLVELGTDPAVERVVDAAARSAGSPVPVTRFRAGSGGSALVRFRRADGRSALLRVARADRGRDPAAAEADALEHLRRTGLRGVPALIDRGRTAGASWCCEALLGGRRPRTLAPSVAAEVAGLCSRLPMTDGPPSAPTADVATIVARLPDRAAAASRAADLLAGASLPGILRHGDLWSGNLLVSRGRLSGVVDWDAWHPSAVPGTDLLHLVASEEGLRGRLSMGELWRQRPWLWERYRRVSAPYWNGLGVRPGKDDLERVGLAWWIGQVAVNLDRLPELSGDARWVETNVDSVLDVAAR